MVWLDRIIFYSLCALIFVLPASIAGAEIFTYLACVLFLVKRGIEISRKQTLDGCVPLWIKVPLLGFLAVCGLSVLWSQAPQLTTKAFFGKSLMAALLFVTVIGTVRDRERFVQILQVFLVSAFILCLDGLWQVWSGYDLFKNLPLIDGRMHASMRHPNDLGAYLIFAVLAMMMFVIVKWMRDVRLARYRRLLAVVAGFIVLFVAMGLTFSRSAWLGALVGVLVFIFMRRKYVMFCLSVTVFFGVVFLPMMVSVRKVTFVSDNTVLTSPPASVSTSVPSYVPETVNMSGTKEFSGSDRLNIWKEAVMIIRDYPVLGTGLNTYTVMIDRYSQYKKLYAHNCYLQMAAELGIVGLGIFLWFLWSVGRFVLVRIMPVRNDPVSILLAGLFAGWIGFLVESGLDTTFYSVQLSRLMWFMMGMLVAGAFIVKKESEAGGRAV